MVTFQDVVDILDDAVGGKNVKVGRPHGAFWRNTTRDQFIKKKIRAGAEDWPLIDLGFGNTSNLVLALRGKDPFDGNTFPRMPPPPKKPVPEESIGAIKEWIDDRCPR